MLTADHQKVRMNGMPPYAATDAAQAGKLSDMQNASPLGGGINAGVGSVLDPSSGIAASSQGTKLTSALDGMKSNSNVLEFNGKRAYQGEIANEQKRLRLEEDSRNFLQYQQLQQQHQLQLEQQQLQQQNQLQFQLQQTQGDIPVDNMVARNWGNNVGVDPANMNSMLRAIFPSGQTQTNSSVGQSNLFLDDNSIRRAEISAQLIREQAATNAAFLASIGRPQMDNILSQGGNQSALSWQSLQQQNNLNKATSQQSQHLASFRSIAELDPFRQSTSNLNVNQGQALTSLLNNHPSNASTERSQDLASLIRQMQSSGAQDMQSFGYTGSFPSGVLHDDAMMGLNLLHELPPCEEGLIESYTKRPSFPLGIDEDPNWLSEFHCYVRSELVEVFRASNEDVKARNNSIAYHQVGIRCKFCAHMTPSARAGRSSAFPSSLRQIYQSFTMMLRDHFGNCDAMPSTTQERFVLLKDKPAQGATDSKRYWVYSAMKIGMTDSAEGIMMNEHTRASGARSNPFGTNPGQRWEDDAFRSVPLVLPSDRPLVSEFLFVLMSQVQPIRLTEAECIGNRRSLRVGLPGFGCRYCCENRRLGLCRMFPARRRTLPSKVNDAYDHLRRCTVCPEAVKKQLDRTKHQMNSIFHADQGGDREFFDRVWSRLGHESQSL